MREYMARYVHKISPRDSDVEGPFSIPGSAFSNRNTLAKAMRVAGILSSGERLRSFRVEADRIVTFPQNSIWHSIVLTEGAYDAPGVDYPGHPRDHRKRR